MVFGDGLLFVIFVMGCFVDVPSWFGWRCWCVLLVFG